MKNKQIKTFLAFAELFDQYTKNQMESSLPGMAGKILLFAIITSFSILESQRYATTWQKAIPFKLRTVLTRFR
jgi:hypothetical protein